MLDDVANLVDLMYRIGEIAQKTEDREKVGIFNDAYAAVRDWQAFLGESASRMRERNWIEAKIRIDKAPSAALSPAIEKLLPHVPNFKGAMATYRQHRERYHAEILRYPSRTTIPRDRIKVILDVQEQYLRLRQVESTHKRKPRSDERAVIIDAILTLSAREDRRCAGHASYEQSD
jgi:hypothetical protein